MRTYVPILLALITGTAVGGAGMHLYNKYEDRVQPKISKRMVPFFKPMLEDLFFKSSPFQQMQRMREEMDKLMSRGFSNFPDSDFYNESKLNDIHQDEDDRFVYYRIKLENIDKDSLKVDVANQHVSISGQSSHEESNKDEGSESQFKSYMSFSRTIPVPRGVDESRVSFETKDSELIVKFPKISQAKINVPGQLKV